MRGTVLSLPAASPRHRMTPLFRNLLIAAAAVLVLVLAAPFLVPASAWRGQVEAELSRAMGRPVTIAGPMSLTLLPEPGIQAEDVRLATRKDAVGPPLAEIGNLHITAQFWPLFTGRIALSDVVMERPVIHLRVDRDGKPNWQLEGARNHAGDSAFGWMRTSVAQVKIEDGRVYYDNAHWQTHAAIEDVDATLVWLGRALTLDGTLRQGAEHIAFDVRLPAPGALLVGKSTPVDLSITSDLLQASFKGAMMLNGPAVGRLKLNTPSLRRLAAWRGHRLPPGGGLEPLSIEAQLHFDGWMIALSKLTMALDESTVQGDMVIDAHDAVPVIHGRLKLDHAVLDPYVTPPATQTRPAREGWNTVPVNLSLLKLFAADLHVESGPLSFEGVTIDKAAFDATLKDSVLNIRFPALSLYGGRGTAELRIDAHGRVPAYRGRVALSGVAAKPFLRDALDVSGLDGTMTLNVESSTAGASRAQTMTALSGRGNIMLSNGRVTGSDLEAMGRMIHFGPAAPTNWSAAITPFDTMRASFSIARGVLTTNDLQLSSGVTEIKGEGYIGLGTRTIDLGIRSRTRLVMDERPRNDIADFAQPYRIGGSWSSLLYTPEPRTHDAKSSP